MSSSELTSLSPSPAPSVSGKKASLVVKLKLSKDKLKEFTSKAVDSDSTPTAAVGETAAPSGAPAAGSSQGAAASPSVGPAAASPAASDGTNGATPSAPNGTTPVVNNRKRGKVGGSGLRPGPKSKRQKLDGQSPVGSVNGTPGLPHPHPKLGPKSNTGAINAGLRALDRSGNPCKRWKKAEFKLKSFTGFEWGIGGFKPEQVPPKSIPSTPETNGVSTASADSANGTTPMEGLELTKPETLQTNGTPKAGSGPIATDAVPAKPEEAKPVDKDVNGLKPDEPNKTMNGIKEGMHSPLVASAV